MMADIWNAKPWDDFTFDVQNIGMHSASGHKFTLEELEMMSKLAFDTLESSDSMHSVRNSTTSAARKNVAEATADRIVV